MEYCDKGDLSHIIKEAKNKNNDFIDENLIWKIFSQILQALRECHCREENPILHRDIKPANIFICKNSNVKLGDFGLSKVLCNESMYAYTNVGTPYYMSPEQINEEKYNHKSDIWSLGCIIYETAALKPPFQAENCFSLAMKIKEGKFDRIPSHYSDDLQSVVEQMLSVDQSKRPSVMDLLAHPKVAFKINEARLKDRAREVQARDAAVSKREKAVAEGEARVAERLARLEERERAIEERERIVSELEARYSKFSKIDGELLNVVNSQNYSKNWFHPLSSRYSNATTANTNESHLLTRHLSYKSVEQAFDKSSNSYKASIISQCNNLNKKSPTSDGNELASSRHKPNALSVQSGIMSNTSSSKNNAELKSRNQSPLSNQNMIQSVISENSQEMKNEEDSENFEKVEIEYTNKVSESVDKLFKDNETARQRRKILMVGEKRVTGDASSSNSRERELLKFYKNPALIKSNDNAQEKNSAKKLKNNINKEFAKKYANKFEVCKKRQSSDTRLNLTADKENIPINLMANNTRNVANNSIQSSMANLAKFNTISNSLAKENCEENDDNVGIISPPEFVTPRTTISKNKFANLNFGKGKNGMKESEKQLS